MVFGDAEVGKRGLSTSRAIRLVGLSAWNKTIVVNPENQFGLPVIEGTNILTDTIYDMILGGEDKEIICKSYSITINNINDVVEFSKAA